jgi:FAD-dependent urate hydroxylase
MVKERYSHTMTIETRSTKVLVVGGGIAGTVAAIALRKAGFAPIVAEALDVAADGVGAFLTLAPNGVSGLRALDLDTGILAAGFDTPRFVISLGDGHVCAELSAGADTKTIRRSDFYTGLRREADRQGIRFEYGKRLIDARCTGRSVVALFEDGTELDADLLIGADGIHSCVRSLLDEHAPRLRYLGLLNTGGFARGVDVPGQPGTLYFVFGKRCFFGWARHPSGEVWWFANPSRAKEPSRAELAAITPEVWHAELVDLLSADNSPARAIVEATERIIGPWPTHDLPAVRTWHRDRTIIIGDAVHAASPSSGQGASMAVEDALVLAKCLRDAPELERALVTYERLRRDRVEKIVAQGRRNGTGKTPGPFGRAMRDLFLRVVFPVMARRDAMAWIHDHRIDWDSPGVPS